MSDVGGVIVKGASINDFAGIENVNVGIFWGTKYVNLDDTKFILEFVVELYGYTAVTPPSIKLLGLIETTLLENMTVFRS